MTQSNARQKSSAGLQERFLYFSLASRAVNSCPRLRYAVQSWWKDAHFFPGPRPRTMPQCDNLAFSRPGCQSSAQKKAFVFPLVAVAPGSQVAPLQRFNYGSSRPQGQPTVSVAELTIFVSVNFVFLVPRSPDKVVVEECVDTFPQKQ